MSDTPVIFFAFNRPDTTYRVLAALKQQTLRPPKIIAFVDGARSPLDEARIAQVKRLIQAVDWTGVELHEREKNFGTAANIIGGISEVFEQGYSQAIIIEDDVLPAPATYESFCHLLAHYKNDQQVFSVGGFPHLLKNALPNYPYEVIMSLRFGSWGWGTWAERWQSIVADLRDFQNPYSNPADIPPGAGADLAGYLPRIQARPGFYWDIPLVLLSLQRQWVHAHTAYYLIQNIGFREGVSFTTYEPELEHFMHQNVHIQNRLPQVLAPVEVQQDVLDAVEAYIYTYQNSTYPAKNSGWRAYYKLLRWRYRLIMSLRKLAQKT